MRLLQPYYVEYEFFHVLLLENMFRLDSGQNFVVAERNAK